MVVDGVVVVVISVVDAGDVVAVCSVTCVVGVVDEFAIEINVAVSVAGVSIVVVDSVVLVAVGGVVVVVSGVLAVGSVAVVSGVVVVVAVVVNTGKFTKMEEAIHFYFITTLDIYLL